MTATEPIAAERPLVQRIEDEIIAGTLKPGDHLGEVGLAKRFGVSRTPLRNALTRLSEMGWVRIVPNVGTFVKEITPLEVAELFLVRRSLEGLAAELLCRRWNAEHEKSLRKLADAYRKRRLAKRYYETRMSNCAFHKAIVDASGCQALKETVERMRLIVRCEMGRHPFEDQLGSTPADEAVTHYDMLDALASSKPQQARKAAEQHLEQVRRRILELLIG